MAGGGYGQGSGIPLRDRVRTGSARPVDHEPSEDEIRGGCPGRHCWVTAPGEGAGTPGLLLEWRRTGPGWEGRVVYLAQRGDGRWVSIEEWLPAPLLTHTTP